MQPAFKQKNVPIVFASDATYAPHLYTAVDSLLANFSPTNHADIIVLVEKPFEPGLVEAFSRLSASCPHASLRFLQIPPDINREIASLRVNPRFGAATYYRLFITRILPAFDRIVYCDVDVVIPGDVSELFAIDLGECCLGACLDVPQPADVPAPAYPNAAEELRLRRANGYFNAGVLLMDLARMRREGWEKRLAERVGSVHEYHYLDQDLLNIVFEGAWRLLPFGWNFYFALLGDHRFVPDEQKRLWEGCAREKTWGIVHFPGTKPWSLDPLLDRNETYFEWESYALRNPLLDWSDMRRAVQEALRDTKRNLFWRYLRLLALPTTSRRQRYRRKRRQYLALRRDAQILENAAHRHR